MKNFVAGTLALAALWSLSAVAGPQTTVDCGDLTRITGSKTNGYRVQLDLSWKNKNSKIFNVDTSAILASGIMLEGGYRHDVRYCVESVDGRGVAFYAVDEMGLRNIQVDCGNLTRIDGTDQEGYYVQLDLSWKNEELKTFKVDTSAIVDSGILLAGEYRPGVPYCVKSQNGQGFEFHALDKKTKASADPMVLRSSIHD